MSVERFFYSKLLSYFPFQATKCQDTLFTALSKFVIEANDEDSDNVLIVNGYAGTGKTSAIAAFIKTMKSFSIPFVLMAPTGRSAKVLSNYTHESTHTIHKQIYRQKSLTNGVGSFTINKNDNSDTFFIIDEASLISTDSQGSIFGSGDLLGDLFEYLSQKEGNKLILIGDDAQLPPISCDRSPALDVDFMKRFGNVKYLELRSVVRQAEESGILFNATILRKSIEKGDVSTFPKLQFEKFEDVKKIGGSELIDALNDSIDKYGIDDTVVLCRSNKRANKYNAGIRSMVLYREEQLGKGDKLMVVKNCYQFEKTNATSQEHELEFIANGDVGELMKISNYQDRYGLHFADAILSFPDYNNIEIKTKVILDTLNSETASLSFEQQKALYEGVYADYDNIKTKRKRNSAVREDKYYNALQIKYASAITCHKSQGGQWSSVFVDNSVWGDELSINDLKWLYTAITRAVKKLYFVNFNKRFYE